MQIYDWLCDKILLRELKAGDQLPSVREIAQQLEVNPNTVMRAIERLLLSEIIYSQRGKGNYVNADARNKVLAQRKQRFYEEQLPALADEMKVLGLSIDDILGPLSHLLTTEV